MRCKGASVVIWTTTPWTIPGNRAIAYSPTMSYGLYEVAEEREGALPHAGGLLLLGDELAQQTANNSKLVLRRVADVDPTGLVCAHPFCGQGFDFDVPLLPGEHVTADTGTGFVHTAPGHGDEDFTLMMDLFPGYAANNPDAFGSREGRCGLRGQCSALSRASASSRRRARTATPMVP